MTDKNFGITQLERLVKFHMSISAGQKFDASISVG
jgi:hypothetical protein